MANIRLTLIVILCIIATWVAIPWSFFGWEKLNIFDAPEYSLGLDLHGGVELDYTVDFQTKEGQEDINRDEVLDNLKHIIEKRVNSLGSAEPTIKTAKYGTESHIIVQIPTKTFADLTPEEQEIRNQEFIDQAKKTIGKVVRLEFKQQKTTITDADRQERKVLADTLFLSADTGGDFITFGQKSQDQNENVFFLDEIVSLDQIPAHLSPISDSIITQESQTSIYATELIGREGFAFSRIITEDGGVKVQTVFIDAQPSAWEPVIADNGQVLDERFLIRATPSFDGQRSVVQLLFNGEGGEMFGDITGRLVGQQLAIFVGGEIVSAPVVQARIPGGTAVITGGGSDGIKWARTLAENINTGIVPAPIYLSSENSINPKLGINSLKSLSLAGVVGFFLIGIFLIWRYGVSGFLATLCLGAYLVLVLAFVRIFPVILTLSGVAGLVLSLGMAIDANILLLERLSEVLTREKNIHKALREGFESAWLSIWDSNITGALVAAVLLIFGVSLIKGFGGMLLLGVLVSLLVTKWIVMPVFSLYFTRKHK